MATLPAIEPLRVPNPLEGYAQVEQILGARQQREVNALVMQQRQQALEAEEQIRRYQAGGGDPRGLLRFGAAGVKAFEQQIKGEKEFAELAASRFTMGRDLVLRASNPEALVNTVRSFFRDPVLGPTLTGLGQNVEGLTQYIVQNSNTPGGFDGVRLQLGQKAEDLGKSIQEMLSERQVAAALGGGALGAPAGAPAAPAAAAAAAPAGTAVATPVAGTTGVPEVTDYASRWQQMVNAGIAAPAPGERPAPAGAAPGGPTVPRLQPAVLLAPLSLNAMAPAAPVAPPANAMVAQAAPGTPAAGGIDISAIDPYAQRRDQLESRLRQTFNKDARAAIIAELNALPKPAAGVQEYLAYVRQEQAAGRRPVGIEQYKQNLARAGATNVPINVSTEKKYGEAFGGKMAEVDINKFTAAEKAPQMAENANRIIELARNPNIFVGPIADIKLNIARAFNIVGANNEESISNTERLIAATSQSTLNAIKDAGLGANQGFTNKDLEFLQGVAGGTVNLTAQTLTELAQIQHRVAVRAAEAWNKRSKEMPRDVIAGTGLSTEPIVVPPLSRPAQGGRQMSPEDRQALDWANKNPNDPRATQIKQRLGVR